MFLGPTPSECGDTYHAHIRCQCQGLSVESFNGDRLWSDLQAGLYSGEALHVVHMGEDPCPGMPHSYIETP